MMCWIDLYAIGVGINLDSGAQVTLYIGSGSDSATELYWCSGTAIWNNGGDTIFVYDALEENRLEHSYS